MRVPATLYLDAVRTHWHMLGWAAGVALQSRVLAHALHRQYVTAFFVPSLINLAKATLMKLIHKILMIITKKYL